MPALPPPTDIAPVIFSRSGLAMVITWGVVRLAPYATSVILALLRADHRIEVSRTRIVVEPGSATVVADTSSVAPDQIVDRPRKADPTDPTRASPEHPRIEAFAKDQTDSRVLKSAREAQRQRG